MLRVASRQRHRAGAGDAASDFAALLLNMSPNPVIAYESVYTSEEGLLMQNARRRAALPRRAPACMGARFLPQPAGRARCGLYRGLASSLSQFLALEREDFNL